MRHTVRQGPTLVIVRSTTGHTFGAYAHAPWTSVNAWTDSAGCFLFLVENPHNDEPTCFECLDTAVPMYCHSNYGPTFGGGHDLCIHESFDAGRSFTRFPRHYNDTLGRGRATFTGASDSIGLFAPEEYEVWAVI